MKNNIGAPEQTSFDDRFEQANAEALRDIMRAKRGVKEAQARSILEAAVTSAKKAAEAQAKDSFEFKTPSGFSTDLIKETNAKTAPIVRANRVSIIAKALVGTGIRGQATGISESTAKAIAELMEEEGA